jgi:hypothetical protein
MRKLSVFIVLVLLTYFLSGCGTSKKSEWEERGKLKELERTIVKAIKLLESEKYYDFVKFVHKPDIIAQNTEEDLIEYSKNIGEHAAELIEVYEEILRTEPRYMDYNDGRKPEGVDMTVIFMLQGGFLAFDKIGDKWYQQ